MAAIHRRLTRNRAKRRALKKQEARARRTRATRRTFLAGLGAAWRLQVRPALTAWVMRVLGKELTGDDQRLFGLEEGPPLIPEREMHLIRGLRPAPGRPNDKPAEARADVQDSPRLPRRMSSARRRKWIAELEREEAELMKELAGLLKEEKEDKDVELAPPNQRLILLGAALLKLARRRPGVTRWLRVLLARELRAARDRKLFRLGQPGHLVPDEDVEEEENAERPRTRKKSAAATSGAQGADANRGGSSRPSAAVSEGRRSRGPTAGGGGAAPPPDAGAPIPGWRPRRITAADSPEAGARKQPDWGAFLEGHAAVAALPAELPGRTITVTDSNGGSWNTVITAVVSRDDAFVLVRNSGRPRAGLSPARHLRGYLGEREPRFR